MIMITKKTKIWKFFSHFFVSIDQLGNALAGGNPDNTISARVGYYNHHYNFESGKIPWYWSWFEKIIDFTFHPVDGPNHCHEAYHNDAGEVFDDSTLTNFLIGIAATIIIIPSCIVIALVLYLLSALRLVKPKTIERDKNLIKRFETCCLILEGAQQEIEHHGLDFNLQEVKQQFNTLMKKAKAIEQTLDENG